MLTPAIRATCASPQKEHKCGLVRTFARASSISIGSVASTLTRNGLNPLLGSCPRQIGERLVEFGFVIGAILEFPCVEIDIGLHVEVAVTAKVEKDCARNAFRLATQGLLNRPAHRVIGLRRRQDALGAGKLKTRLEATRLRVGA